MSSRCTNKNSIFSKDILTTTNRSQTDILYCGKAAQIERTDRIAGWTKLHEKAYRDELKESDIASLSPKEIDHRDRYGQSALWVACAGSRERSFNILVNAGANLHQKDNQNRTLLHAIASYPRYIDECKKMIQLLLRNKVDPYAKDILGNTMLDYLKQKPSIINTDTMMTFKIQEDLYKYIITNFPKSTL